MNEKGFKWDAELYDKSSRFQYNLGLMAIERLKPIDGEKILEIGCGNAMLTIELAKQIPHGKITGLELSEDQCIQAKDNINKESISNVELINMDAMKLDHENTFDAVFSNSAIHWITDLESMYKRIHSALKPGGRIMIQTGLKETNELFLVILKLIRVKKFRKHLKEFKLPWRFLTKKQNEKILEESGFTNILVEPYHYTMKFKDEEEMWNYCKAAPLVPFLTFIPDHEKREFLGMAKQIYLEVNAETPLEISMNRVFLSASK